MLKGIFGVNSLFVHMTWEDPISFYCEIKVVMIIKKIVIVCYIPAESMWRK